MNLIKRLFGPIGAIISYIQNHFRAMLFLLLLYLIFMPSSDQSHGNYNLQAIELTGPIFDTTDIVKELAMAEKNKNIRGVMLIVDSPGGSVPPSLEVAYAIKRLKAEKPVIVYAKGMLTSGSYYASIWADEIIANPGSVVGSIGVIMQGLNLEGLLEKVGVKTQIAKAGKYKRIGAPDRLWTDFEREEIEKVIKATYDMFVKDVAQARELNASDHTVFADAHIFTASQAKQVGLVDALGVEYDARKKLEQLSGVTKPIWKDMGKFDRFLRNMGAESSSMLYRFFPIVTLK